MNFLDRPYDAMYNILEHDVKAKTEAALQRKNIAFANFETMKMQGLSDRSRPTNQASGFQRAGFSPLAMLGNPISAPVSSSLSSPSPSNGPVSSSSLLELANAKLTLAQADKTQTEANRMHNEDSGAAEAVKSYAEAKLRDNPNMEPEKRAYYEALMERDNSGFNVGDIKSEINLKNLVTKDVDTAANVIKKDYENYLWSAYKSGDKALVDLNLQEAQLGKFFSEIANIETNTLLQSMEVQLKPHEAQKLDSEVARNLAEADSTYHGDVAALWKNGDFQALLAKGGAEVLNTALQVAASRAGGLGYAANKAAATRGILKNGRPASSAKTSEFRENLAKAQLKNERVRKYVEQREKERRARLRNSAMPL